MNLASLSVGQKATILDFQGEHALVQRLLELGLTDGEVVEVLRFAPLGDPMEIRVRGYHLSLRKSEAVAVLVELIP
jgi:Fe2+ transport system protein FeoA